MLMRTKLKIGLRSQKVKWMKNFQKELEGLFQKDGMQKIYNCDIYDAVVSICVRYQGGNSVYSINK